MTGQDRTLWKTLSHVSVLATFPIELHSCLPVGEEVSEPFCYSHPQALVKQCVNQLLSPSSVVSFADVK